MSQFDVAFIGSDRTTLHAATTLKQAGQSVVFIAPDFRADATVQLPYTQRTKQSWQQWQATQQQVVQQRQTVLHTQLKKMSIPTITGNGILMGPHLIQVGQTNLSAKNIIIATGQKPQRLDISGKEFLHTADDLLALSTLPQHVTLIGAGRRSLELASLLLDFGTQVTIIERRPRALQQFSVHHVTNLISHLEVAGAHCYFNETPLAIDVTTDGLQITTATGRSIDTQYVIDATRNRANITHLGLENAGIHSSTRGINVDDHLRANGANIYASGSVLAKDQPQSPAVATFEATYIAGQILGNTEPISYPAIPQVLFTSPQLAQIGVTPEAAATDPNAYHLRTISYDQLATDDAELTGVFNRQHQLVGAAIYGHEASEITNVLALIIDQHLTAHDLSQMIFAFPTTTQTVIAALLPAMMPATVAAH